MTANASAALLAEFEAEAATTRRFLERVPHDQLAWRPHPKSMSLGQLALHLAGTPGFVAGMSVGTRNELPDLQDGFDQPADAATILSAHDGSVRQVRDIVATHADEAMPEDITLLSGGQVFMELPRGGLLRALMLNHWYHHRGQLSVYLRLLDVDVPSAYGPSADEAPLPAVA